MIVPCFTDLVIKSELGSNFCDDISGTVSLKTHGIISPLMNTFRCIPAMGSTKRILDVYWFDPSQEARLHAALKIDLLLYYDPATGVRVQATRVGKIVHNW